MSISSGLYSISANIGFTINKTNVSLNDTGSSQGFGTSVQRSAIGTGANNFNEGYCAVRTLNANTSETLDLSGSLVNLLGETIAFARVYGLSIELLNTAQGGNTATSTSIAIGNANSNQFQGPLSANSTETVKNGGVWINALSQVEGTGWNVANNSSDNLKITNLDASNIAVYRIFIPGATS